MTTTPTPETTTNEPAAWIGCLHCYNGGRLRGAWITANEAVNDQLAETLSTFAGLAEIATYPNGQHYARCCRCGGDEFDVFDTEHLPTKMTAAEFYANAETLAGLDADTLERLTVLGAWQRMTLEELVAYDDEHYVGQWDTFQDYAESYADDVALLADTPDWIARYFDMEAFARDLAHDFYHDDATGHTWHSA